MLCIDLCIAGLGFEKKNVGRADMEETVVLTNLGEKMSDDEVDELLKAVDTTSGEINYVGTLHSFPPASTPFKPSKRCDSPSH